MNLIIDRIPITESRGGVLKDILRKLSNKAERLLGIMADAYNKHGKDSFSVNDLRGVVGFQRWRIVRNLFYELESRDLGKVDSKGTDFKFTAFIPVLQSLVTEDVKLDDEDEFGCPDTGCGQSATDIADFDDNGTLNTCQACSSVWCDYCVNNIDEFEWEDDGDLIQCPSCAPVEDSGELDDEDEFEEPKVYCTGCDLECFEEGAFEYLNECDCGALWCNSCIGYHDTWTREPVDGFDIADNDNIRRCPKCQDRPVYSEGVEELDDLDPEGELEDEDEFTRATDYYGWVVVPGDWQYGTFGYKDIVDHWHQTGPARPPFAPKVNDEYRESKVIGDKILRAFFDESGLQITSGCNLHSTNSESHRQLAEVIGIRDLEGWLEGDWALSFKITATGEELDEGSKYYRDHGDGDERAAIVIFHVFSQ